MKRGKQIQLALSYIIVIGSLVVFLFPIVWLTISSFKPPADLLEMSLPSQLTLENYQVVVDTYPVTLYLRNSLLTAVGSTLLSVCTGALAAYGLARYRFRGNRLALLFMLVLRMLPGIAVGIPLYLLFSKLQLTENRISLILAECAVFQIPLVTWIMYGFFQDIPFDLAEAGLVDGCTRLSVLYHIVLPLAAPGLAVAAVFAFLISWNDFGLSLTLVSTPDMLTMPVALAQMNMQYGVRWDNMSAAAIMYIIPTMIMALLLQRYITRGLTAGAIKG